LGLAQTPPAAFALSMAWGKIHILKTTFRENDFE
jgi:hypothetical protein